MARNSADRNITWCNTTGKWKVKLTRDGKEHFLGRFTERHAAREARDRFEEQYALRPRVSARHSSADAHLRVAALRAVRMQFAATDPMELIKAAEQVYQWLKQSDTVSAPSCTAPGTDTLQ